MVQSVALLIAAFRGGGSSSSCRVNAGAGSRKCVLPAKGLLPALGFIAVTATVSYAQDATWTGAVSGDWQTAANWSPAVQPTGTAIFGASSQTTITFSDNDFFHPLSVGTIQLDAGSPTYTFRPNYLALTGLGIVNNSSNAPIFASFAALSFRNASTAANASIITSAPNGNTFDGVSFLDASNAGSATITSTGGAYFSGTATAANATINTSALYISNGGITSFSEHSSAGSATLNNSSGAQTLFIDTATAAFATINNTGVFFDGFVNHAPTTARFGDSSTAANALIANTDGGRTEFVQSSTAGSAIITNSGRDIATDFRGSTLFLANANAGSSTITNNQFALTGFAGTASAAQATITNNNGGFTSFFDTSTAANATIINNDGGVTIFYQTSSAGNARIVSNAGGAANFATTGPITAGSIEGAGQFYINSSRLSTGSNNLDVEVSGKINGVGSLEKVGTGVLILSGDNAYSGGTTITAGTLQIGNGGTSGSILGDVTNNARLAINRSDAFVFENAVSGSGGFRQAGPGTTILTAANTYGGGTTIAAGTLQLGNGGTAGSILGDVVNNGIFAINRSDGLIFNGQISGTGSFQQIGSGSTILTGASSYLGGTTVNAGLLLLTGAGTLGAAAGSTTINAAGTLDLGWTSQLQSAVMLNGGVLQNGNLNGSIMSTGGRISDVGGGAGLTTTAGLTTLTGVNVYTGATNVNGGVLNAAGTLTGTAAVNVNGGGVLTGLGTIASPAVTVAALGTFAPGNATSGSSINIAGHLAFQAGALYLVQINPATASFANVTGAASLGGATVNAVFAPGAYVQKTYTILSASDGMTGAFAATVANTNLPANFKTDLSYDATHAYLDLSLKFVPPPGSGLKGNQQSVGNAIVGFFDRTGGIPLIYGGLTAGGLAQASGESATGSQQISFNAMNQFMGILTDPFSGRGQAADGPVGATGFAGESAGADAATKGARTDAFAMFTKAPPAVSAERRWRVWAAGFGGSQSTDGNAAAGSSDTTSRIYGTAVGADYRLLPGTTLGFALAGGGSSFSVGNLGSGRSDLFQAGGYVRQAVGHAYVQAALAYGWQDVTTNRTVTISGIDQLQARFNANTYSGRIEGGYRLITPVLGGLAVTPYAAGQFTTVDLPAYAEKVLAGTSAFALAYGSRSVTDTRSELGVRTEKSFVVADGILGLRGRLAWAHDFNTDRSVAATFQALPGASFAVNGARQAADAALTTASAEMGWLNGWSVSATFEGEFSHVTRSYAGKGGVKYQW